MNTENLEFKEETLTEEELSALEEVDVDSYLKAIDMKLAAVKCNLDKDPAALILKDYASVPALTRDETKDLFTKLRSPSSDSASKEKIREILINSNLKLVAAIAFRNTHRGIDLADLIQEGSLGLMQAVDKYDPTKGFTFATYAFHWIQQSIDLLVQKSGHMITIPMYIDVKIKRLRRTIFQISKLKGIPDNEVTLEEIAESSPDMEMPEIESLYELMTRQVAIVENFYKDDNHDFDIRDEALDPEEVQAHAASIAENEIKLKNLINECLEKPMYRDILRMRFGIDTGIPMTLGEVAEFYTSQGHKMTKEAVRQLQEKAIKILRRSENIHKFKEVIL